MQAKVEVMHYLVSLHLLRRSVYQQSVRRAAGAAVRVTTGAQREAPASISSSFKSMHPGVTAFTVIGPLSPHLDISKAHGEYVPLQSSCWDMSQQ